jgi:hypothetical protein
VNFPDGAGTSQAQRSSVRDSEIIGWLKNVDMLLVPGESVQLELTHIRWDVTLSEAVEKHLTQARSLLCMLPTPSQRVCAEGWIYKTPQWGCQASSQWELEREEMRLSLLLGPREVGLTLSFSCIKVVCWDREVPRTWVAWCFLHTERVCVVTVAEENVEWKMLKREISLDTFSQWTSVSTVCSWKYCLEQGI